MLDVEVSMALDGKSIAFFRLIDVLHRDTTAPVVNTDWAGPGLVSQNLLDVATAIIREPLRTVSRIVQRRNFNFFSTLFRAPGIDTRVNPA